MRPPPALNPPRLRPDEAHAWLVKLDEIDAVLPGWESLLSEGERKKAGRFVRPEDRHRSAASRAALRCLLGHYLELPPAEVSFTYNRFGKPAMDGRTHCHRLAFSVSHSGDYALIGMSGRAPVGVDIESVRGRWSTDGLAGEICTPGELQRIVPLPEPQRSTELLRLWTLKEAYLKALGVGLSFSPRHVEVAGPVGLILSPNFNYTLKVPGRWTVTVLGNLPEGHAAAVAVAATSITPELRWFDSVRW